MMNGYSYRDLLGRNGKSVLLEVDGKRMAFHGEPSTPPRLLVNGAEARPSGVVHAGDRIEFVPAVDGTDRVVLAGELMEQLGAVELWMDGDPVPPEVALPNRAQLQTRGTVAREERAEPAAPPVQKVSLPTVEEPAAPPVQETPIPAAGPSAPPTAAPAPQKKGQRVTLNGNPLLLPGKADGGPYYLMDLLEYSGIDFQHLNQPVLLRINGQPCTFQQRIQEDDRVEIRCDSEERRPLPQR